MNARSFIALALLGACGPTPIDDARQDLIVRWGTWLLERYAQAATNVDVLGARVDELCEAPDEARLEAARAAWVAAREPWKQAEVFGFGPYSELPLRIGPQADFWPARPESVRDVLAGDGGIDVAQMGAHVRGFTAIELVLWDPALDPLAALRDQPRRCEYLAAIVPDLAFHIRALREQWAPEGANFLGELSEAGERDTQYMTLQMAFGEVVNRVGYLLENIRNDKLGKPVGIVSGGGPQPDIIESQFSGRGLDDIRDNLAGVRFLLLGDGVDRGLDGYLQTRGRHLRKLVSERLAAVEAAIDAIDEPLGVAVVDAPEGVEALIDRLGELQRVVQVDVLNALSLSVGFNDNDGD